MVLEKLIVPKMVGKNITIRPIELTDCTDEYVSWLNDPWVSKYLETRLSEQTLNTVKEFVATMIDSKSNYLFAIIANINNKHIGNIKVGPINFYHKYADISYFIGDKNFWGKGYATEAIELIAAFAFKELHLHILRAGVYSGNIGSQKALLKSNFRFEAKFQDFLCSQDHWEDHLWYVKVNSECVK